MNRDTAACFAAMLKDGVSKRANLPEREITALREETDAASADTAAEPKDVTDGDGDLLGLRDADNVVATVVTSRVVLCGIPDGIA